MDETEVTHCVTIVHGTFVHGLKAFTKNNFQDQVPVTWANSDSLLHQALTRRLQDRIVIRHFGWSGRNSHAKREEAAEHLEIFLERNIDRYAQARHYLVCHSHGGNVAMLALRGIKGDDDKSLQNKIAGIACLATPFLVVNDRPLDFSVFKGFFFILMVIASLLIIGAGILSLGYFFDHQQFGDDWKLYFLIFLTSGCYIAMYFYLHGRLSRYIQKLKEGYGKFFLPELGDKLRVIRSTGDEASGVLITGQFISWVIEILWTVVGVVGKIGSNIFILLLALIGGAAVLYYLLSSGWSNTFLDAVFEGGNSMYIIFPLTSLFGVVVGLQLILCFALTMSSLLRFGISYPLMGVLMRVTAEATPLGAVTSYLIPNRDKCVTKKSILFRSHTRVYEDSKVLEYLAEWLADDVREGSTGDLPDSAQ